MAGFVALPPSVCIYISWFKVAAQASAVNSLQKQVEGRNACEGHKVDAAHITSPHIRLVELGHLLHLAARKPGRCNL